MYKEDPPPEGQQVTAEEMQQAVMDLAEAVVEEGNGEVHPVRPPPEE